MAQNNLTVTQKALVVVFTSVIIDESPSSNTLLANTMNDLNISEFEFDRNVIIIQKLIDLQGEKALHQLKDVSYNDKILILSIFDRALHLGGLSNDQDTIMTYNEILKQADLFQISRTTVKTSTSVNIHLDSSVKSITRTAAYHLSSAIQNGMLISNNNDITIYKNRIDFGKCTNPNFQGKTGMVAPNFYIEYGNVMYYFGNNLKCGWLHKQLDYCGEFPPTSPDNESIFNLIYPRFA